ncbi:MAG: hypothetical protein ACPGN3_07855 [Opitutales bacterium]
MEDTPLLMCIQVQPFKPTAHFDKLCMHETSMKHLGDSQDSGQYGLYFTGVPPTVSLFIQHFICDVVKAPYAPFEEALGQRSAVNKLDTFPKFIWTTPSF